MSHSLDLSWILKSTKLIVWNTTVIPSEAVAEPCGHRLQFASWSNILLISIEIHKILPNWANRGRSAHRLPTNWNAWHGMTHQGLAPLEVSSQRECITVTGACCIFIAQRSEPCWELRSSVTYMLHVIRRLLSCRVPSRWGLRQTTLAPGSDETRTRDPLVR